MVGGWVRGGSWVNRRCLGLGEAHESGSALEGVLGEVLYWGKHIERKVLQKESDNELCLIDGCGCGCGENNRTDDETQEDKDEEEIIMLEVGRHHES